MGNQNPIYWENLFLFLFFLILQGKCMTPIARNTPESFLYSFPFFPLHFLRHYWLLERDVCWLAVQNSRARIASESASSTNCKQEYPLILMKTSPYQTKPKINLFQHMIQEMWKRPSPTKHEKKKKNNNNEDNERKKEKKNVRIMLPCTCGRFRFFPKTSPIYIQLQFG